MTALSESEDAQAKHAVELKEEASKRKHDDEFNQNLFLDVLESTATKREAKAYLSRFRPRKTAPPILKPPLFRTKDVGVNLGKLYLPVRAIDENPVFSHTPSQPCFADEALELLHIALVKIRAPQSIDDITLHGVGHTLSQLARLELNCVVVVDPEDGELKHDQERKRIAIEQADRIVGVIKAYSGQGARRLSDVFGVASINQQLLPSVRLSGGVRITDRDLLLAPLRRGVTPVIAPIGFTTDTQKRVTVDADEGMLGLTQDFAGLMIKASYDDNPEQVAKDINSLQKQIALDRIIVLDPLGGIPSTDRIHGSHVFINLEQEFESIKRDIMGAGTKPSDTMRSYRSSTPSGHLSPTFILSNPSSNIVANESATVQKSKQKHEDAAKSNLPQASPKFHVKNLELMRNTLALLPSSSSAFLTTPDAVANSQSRPPLSSQGPRVRTRRQKNSLIHNLLTDKPVYSSSLPSDRSSNQVMDALLPVVTSFPATFFKRGMPVSLIPDPLANPWTAPSPSNPSISMLDPRIDLPRLIYLIEDSFSRKLDVPHYLNRIKGRIAGIIIAGEYEGGAILTWETPPGHPTDDARYMVPYLDKFAVLKRSQGSGGVSDIVFKAMVRDCFPQGVCWRSRKDNRVNKWYFERAEGACRIPNTHWMMFWTTKDMIPGDAVFLNYEGVCKAVEPSWADRKEAAD